MKKTLKIILISIFVMSVLAFLDYNYTMRSGGRDLTTEKISFSVNSKDISNEFLSNIDKANKKYLEKAISITGKITSVNKNEVIIDGNIICNFKDYNASIKKNEQVIINGRVVGFDDLMGELKLDQCFIQKTK